MTLPFLPGKPYLQVLDTDGSTVLKTVYLPAPDKGYGELEWIKKTAATWELIDGSQRERVLGYLPSLTLKWKTYPDVKGRGLNLGSANGNLARLTDLAVLLATPSGRLRVCPGPASRVPRAVSNVQWMTGDGVLSSGQLVDECGDPCRNPVITALTRTDWQGTQVLSPAARTNLRLYSQDFTISAWSKTNLTVAADSATAPDGTTTADLLVTAAVTGTMRVYRGVASMLGQRRCSSWHVKKQAGSVVRWLRISADQSGTTAWFDLDNGIFGEIGTYAGFSVGVKALADGWYRIHITYNAVAEDSGDNQFLTVVAADGTNTSITGDGVTGFFVWGAQVEDSAVPTSYIPTGISTVTVIDYAVTPSGFVSLGQTPSEGAVLRWSGTQTPIDRAFICLVKKFPKFKLAGAGLGTDVQIELLGRDILAQPVLPEIP